jgi:hypothetical protein
METMCIKLIKKHKELNGWGLLQHDAIMAFTWADWEKSQFNSDNEIWTRDLPNTKQECQSFNHKVR